MQLNASKLVQSRQLEDEPNKMTVSNATQLERQDTYTKVLQRSLNALVALKPPPQPSNRITNWNLKIEAFHTLYVVCGWGIGWEGRVVLLGLLQISELRFSSLFSSFSFNFFFQLCFDFFSNFFFDFLFYF
jgi:hypothetical protein